VAKTILAGNNFAGKNYFATPVFSMGKPVFSTNWQKPVNPVSAS